MFLYADTRLEIILGCMYSGKSTELLRRCNRYGAIGKKILLINHTNDTRTGDSIMTHLKQTQTAVKFTKLMDIFKDTSSNTLFKESHVIGIDEGQFFEDLLEFVKNIEKFGKTIIISGLDGDFNRQPFGQILSCIPLCDEVVKLTAMDMVDKDGTPAIFTKRIADTSEQVHVGATESYEAVSRKNYQ
jgi:thymidine kinase